MVTKNSFANHFVTIIFFFGKFFKIWKNLLILGG